MYAHPIIITGFLLLSLLGLIHTSAIVYFWYWQFPWLDVSVHFLGGLTVGFFVLWFVFRLLGPAHVLWTRGSLYIVLLTVILVGVLWEIFEYNVGISRGSNFAFDTSLDMVMNIVGAVTAVYISRNYFI
jgi:phosphoglycerol transferase MdoB-like AlkP superfamily enzyme